MGKKIAITAQEAWRRYTLYKQLIKEMEAKLTAVNSSLKERNIEIDNLKKELKTVKQKYHNLRNVTRSVWIMNYLDGE